MTQNFLTVTLRGLLSPESQDRTSVTEGHTGMM